MEQITLGKTGLKVNRLRMGGLFIGSRFSGFEGTREAIHRAVDLGVTYADTAPSYGNSELVLGRALDEIDTPIVVSTKQGGRAHPFNPQSRDLLEQSGDMSLRLLGRDHIDILFIHEPDRPGQYDWWKDNRYGTLRELHSTSLTISTERYHQGDRHRRHHRIQDGGPHPNRQVRHCNRALWHSVKTRKLKTQAGFHRPVANSFANSTLSSTKST